mgnify:CR=1 FL=1
MSTLREAASDQVPGSQCSASYARFEPASLHFQHQTQTTELLDGRPHGDEGELLQHFEAEVEASVAHLRQLKAANEEAQGAITQVGAPCCTARSLREWCVGGSKHACCCTSECGAAVLQPLLCRHAPTTLPPPLLLLCRWWARSRQRTTPLSDSVQL